MTGRGIRHRASGTGVKAALLAFVLWSQSGCHVNMSSFNGDLSSDQLFGRVRERFPVGSSVEQVRAQLTRSNLHFWWDDTRLRDESESTPVIQALIEPAKPYVSFYGGATGKLFFWFDQDKSLRGVAYLELAKRPLTEKRDLELIAGAWPGGGA